MSTIKSKQVETRCCTVDVRAELYGTVQELVANNRTRPIRHLVYDVQKRGIRAGWHGVDTYDEAYKLLATGYQPVVERLRSEVKIAQAYVPRFKFSNEVQGFLPVVPLALKGVPNSMIDMRIRPIKSKVLDIYYDMTANCDKDTEDFIKAGKLLLGTILGLESQGYRFNLYAVQSYWDVHNLAHHSVDFMCVKVKSSDCPFDLKRMSFPLAHPAFFRVVGFDWQSKSPITRNIGDGRGRAIGYDFDMEDCNKIAKSVFGNNAIYISCSTLIDKHYDKETLKEALTNVKVA